MIHFFFFLSLRVFPPPHLGKLFLAQKHQKPRSVALRLWRWDFIGPFGLAQVFWSQHMQIRHQMRNFASFSPSNHGWILYSFMSFFFCSDTSSSFAASRIPSCCCLSFVMFEILFVFVWLILPRQISPFLLYFFYFFGSAITSWTSWPWNRKGKHKRVAEGRTTSLEGIAGIRGLTLFSFFFIRLVCVWYGYGFCFALLLFLFLSFLFSEKGRGM